MKMGIPHRYIILADQALFSGTSFLVTILLARLLPIEQFGIYSGILLGIYLVVSAVGAFVIQPFQVLHAKMDDQPSYTIFGLYLQLAVVLLLMMSGTGLACLLPGYFPATALLFGAGFLMHDFGRRLFLATHQPLQALLLDIALTLSLLLSIAAFVLSSERDLSGLFILLSLAYLPPFLMILFFTRPFLLAAKNVRPYFVRHLQDGKWLFMTALSQWWAGNLFVVASGLYLGSAALGALRLSQSLMGILNVLLQIFENHVLPQTARMMYTDSSEAVGYVAATSRKAGLLFIPVLALCFLFAGEIMTLAGGGLYSSYAFALQGISLLYMLVFLNQPIRLLIRAFMLNRHFFLGYLLTLMFSLASSHALLSNWGLKGAIVGLAASQVLLMAYWTIILKRRNIPLWKSFISC